MIAVFKREFLAYFRTPVGYVFSGVFLTMSGIIFYSYNVKNLSGDLLSFLSQLTLLVMILCPLLTMRLICEERSQKTDQLTMTSPVTLTAVVVGKYLAASAILVITIGLTNGFVLAISLCGGRVYAGEWFVGYLGLLLQSLCFLALDLFVTCFAKNQISGAAIAFGANFALWMIDLLADQIHNSLINNIMNFLSLYKHYEVFQVGQLTYAGILFFVSFIIVCLVAAIHVLDARRFSRVKSA